MFEAGETRSVQSCEVQFRIRDVYFPAPAALLDALHGGDVLRGRVVDSSESGEPEEAFAVVEVPGLAQLLVVPQKCISR
jgi:hypothetical protein